MTFKKGQVAWNKNKKCPWVIKRNKDNPTKKGKNHPNWKGGNVLHMGYIYVYNNDGLELPTWMGIYIKRCNLVWFENTGEIIKKPYFLHHKNGDKLDDSFENLQKVTFSYHSKKHTKLMKRNLDGTFAGKVIDKTD